MTTCDCRSNGVHDLGDDECHYSPPGWTVGADHLLAVADAAARLVTPWVHPRRSDPQPSPFVWVDVQGHDMRVDPEGDMGYIRLRDLAPGEFVHRTDLTHDDHGVLIDRDRDGNILGIEIFLCGGEIQPDTAAVLKRLLPV